MTISKKAKKKVSPLKGRMRTPPYSPYPTWSEARFFAYLRGGLRKLHLRWPPRLEALKNSLRDNESDNKRLKKEANCSECKGWFKRDDVEVDHITPCGSFRGFNDLPGFASRMFVGVDDYRVLCKECHLIITNKARGL